jgi:hypothetical protein
MLLARRRGFLNLDLLNPAYLSLDQLLLAQLADWSQRALAACANSGASTAAG